MGIVLAVGGLVLFAVGFSWLVGWLERRRDLRARVKHAQFVNEQAERLKRRILHHQIAMGKDRILVPASAKRKRKGDYETPLEAGLKVIEPFPLVEYTPTAHYKAPEPAEPTSAWHGDGGTFSGAGASSSWDSSSSSSTDCGSSFGSDSGSSDSGGSCGGGSD